MKKVKYIFIAILAITLFTQVPSVEAKSHYIPNSINSAELLSANTITASLVDKSIRFDPSTEKEVRANCNGIFTQEAIDLIKEILNYFRILGPAVFVVMIAVDLLQAVAANDDKAMKKATGKIFKRAIATILLFFVPTIVIILLNMPGIKETMVETGIVDNPICAK